MILRATRLLGARSFSLVRLALSGDCLSFRFIFSILVPGFHMVFFVIVVTVSKKNATRLNGKLLELPGDLQPAKALMKIIGGEN
jgi:hypothetical protein